MSLSLPPLKGYQRVCVCVQFAVQHRQVLTWDCSPGERLQAFPWHPSHSNQRTDYTDFEQAYPYQGMTDNRQSLSLVPLRVHQEKGYMEKRQAFP